jgi:hypothetical protein
VRTPSAERRSCRCTAIEIDGDSADVRYGKADSDRIRRVDGRWLIDAG